MPHKGQSIEHSALPGSTPTLRHTMDDADDKVVYASVHANLLNGWERGFVDNMLNWSGSPIDKQMGRITIIYNKIRARLSRDEISRIHCAVFPLISAGGEFDPPGNLPPVT